MKTTSKFCVIEETLMVVFYYLLGNNGNGGNGIGGTLGFLGMPRRMEVFLAKCVKVKALTVLQGPVL